MSDQSVKRPPSQQSLAAVKNGSRALTIEDLAHETMALRRLFDLHLQETQADRRIAQQRHDALMSILADLIGRLPNGT